LVISFTYGDIDGGVDNRDFFDGGGGYDRDTGFGGGGGEEDYDETRGKLFICFNLFHYTTGRR
jgi:hypothetical protein